MADWKEISKELAMDYMQASIAAFERYLETIPEITPDTKETYMTGAAKFACFLAGKPPGVGFHLRGARTQKEIEIIELKPPISIF